jgi:uncharacterized RDD family membrane protein YckC
VAVSFIGGAWRKPECPEKPREFVIPPLWKRVLAELIDFVVLFYLKIIIMIIVMRQMGGDRH